MNYNVDHPTHYTNGPIECIDAIESSLGTMGFINYCHGNVMKYMWRWKDKNGIEDLDKAIWYIERIKKTIALI